MLALLLGGAAGAQTTSCTAIPDPTVPQFISGNWTRTATTPSGASASVPGGFNFLTNPDAEYLGGRAETLLYNVDNVGFLYYPQRNQYDATSPTVTINNVRFLQTGFVFANNGDKGGDSTIFDFKYNGVTYASIVSPGPSSPDPQVARVVGVNGGTIYDSNGVQQTEITATSKALALYQGGYTGTYNYANNAIIDTDPAYNQDVQIRKMFYIRLPDNVSPTGQLTVSKRVEPAAAYGSYGDDFRIWLPRALSTSLCLQKKLDVGPVPNDFQFTTTGTDNSLVAASATGPVIIPVTNNTNTFSKAPNSGSGPNALAVTNPSSITITENAPGFTITKVDCDRPAYRDGSTTAGKAPTPGNNVVTLASSTGTATITSLTIGAMTTCTFYNTDTTQVAFPKFTLVKNFTGFVNPADSVNISIAEAGGGSSSATVANTGSRTGSTTYTGTKLLFGTNNTTSNTVASGVPPVFTLGESFVTGTASNYTRTYSCTNAKSGSTTTLTTSSTALPVGNQITIQPAQGDNITCTFVNNLTVAVPTTTVNVSKAGPTVMAVGTPTGAATYTITVDIPSGVTRPYIVLKDKITLANGALLPASAVSLPDGGTFDEATQTVTWNGIQNGSPSSNPYQVIVTLPNETLDSINGDGYTGPNLITDTATVETFDRTNRTTPLTNTGTASATVSTNLLYAQVRKTVRNVTQGGPASNTAQTKPGDTLEYCLNYTNQSAVAMDLTLQDTLVAGQTLAAGSFTGGTNTGTGDQVSVKLPGVPAGGSGSVCFQTTVNTQ